MLLDEGIYKFKFSKEKFQKDFITKLFLFLIKKCLFLLFFFLLSPPIFAELTEIAGRMSRLEWESCSLFLKLFPLGSTMCSGTERKEGSPSLWVLSLTCRKNSLATFSKVWTENKLRRCGFEFQLSHLLVMWSWANYSNS